MNIVFGLLSIVIGIYSLPLMINVLNNRVEELHNKVIYYLICFLFVTFPFINFANCIDMLFFETYIVSYVCGVYGFLFIVFSFFAPSNELVKEED